MTLAMDPEVVDTIWAAIEPICNDNHPLAATT
jgi:hypothetical protein